MTTPAMRDNKMKKELRLAEAQYRLAKLRLRKIIEALPDTAEGVKKINENCALVPFSVTKTPGSLLCPRYYLTGATKRELMKILSANKSPEATRKTIEGILATGHLPDYTKIPPNFLKALKQAWEG